MPSKPCPSGCGCGKHKFGKSHQNYKGDDAGRSNKHARIRSQRGKASEYDCVDCGDQALDWSRRKDGDCNNIWDHDPRCRRCHMEYDEDERWGKPGYRENQIQKQSAKAKRQWAEHKDAGLIGNLRPKGR